jgi:hypothetical protein
MVEVQRVCGAIKKDGGVCSSRILMPDGRCRAHQEVKVESASSPESEFYDEGMGKEFQRKLRKARALTNPLDTLGELAVDRALLLKELEKIPDGGSAKIEDVREIIRLTGEIVRKTSLMVKARKETALTVTEVKVVVSVISQLINEYIPDKNKRRLFLKEIRERLP